MTDILTTAKDSPDREGWSSQEDDSPTNCERCEHGEAALEGFANSTGEGRRTDDEDMVADCIADILHFAHSKGMDWRKLAIRAGNYVTDELDGCSDVMMGDEIKAATPHPFATLETV